jgi:hypothetical protein|tara:strand:- start:422 stop:646 length:225 start_codon:yes stop_codon:yes gene_type:complete
MADTLFCQSANIRCPDLGLAEELSIAIPHVVEDDQYTCLLRGRLIYSNRHCLSRQYFSGDFHISNDRINIERPL